MRTLLASPFLTAAILAAWSASSAQAQCGLWDPTIGTPGMEQGGIPSTPSVRCSATYDDGSGPKLFAGGIFGKAGGNPVDFVARWDGASWSGLGTGLNSPAHSMAEYDDGTGSALYVGGQFTQAGGMPAIGIAKWNGAWSRVGTPGLGPTAVVYGLAVANVGGANSLFVAGTFQQAGGQTVNNVARWDGWAWHPLGAAPNVGVSQTAFAVAAYDFDGGGPQPPKAVVGGTFPTAGGVFVAHIAAWDGVVWSGLGNGLSPGTSVKALAVHDEGTGPALFVGGSFNAVNGNTIPAKNIARFHMNTWSAVGDGFDAATNALAEHDDGGGPALHAGGMFTTSGTGATPLRYAARWNGGAWEQLGQGVDTSGGFVHTLTNYVDAAGPALSAGGNFTAVNGGRASNHIALWRGKVGAQRYCKAKLNSLGCTPEIDWTGRASATATSGFMVKCKYTRNHKSGLLFYSTNGRAGSPFQGGTLCVKAPIKRTPAVNSGGTPLPANDCSGVYSIDMNAFASGSLGGAPAPALSTPGTIVNGQWWGRDPGFPPPDNTTLSDAIEYSVCP